MSNATTQTTVSRLRVQHMIAQYLVARDHPAPERVKQLLDGAITTSLADPLAAVIGSSLPESDPAVWRIRRLQADLDLEIDTGRDGDPDAIRAAFARCVDRSLAQAIAEGPDGENVVRFPDRAAFLAGYLEERAEGLKVSWYYETFEGLRLLSPSAAIRTAVLDDPEIGLAALKSLGPDRLKRVLGALTARDAERVLDTLAEADIQGDPSACAEAVKDVRGRLLSASPEASALFLYVQAYVPDRVAGRSLREAAVAVAVAERQTEPMRRGARDFLPTDAFEAPPAPFERPPETPAAVSAPERRKTSFGGAFLLLPILDALPIPDATGGWPDAEGTRAAELVRFLILVKCLGPLAFFDPLLRELMSISPDLQEWDVLEWQSFLSREDRSHFLEILDRWYLDRGAITLETQSLTRVAGKAILLDHARGQWRRIFSSIEARPDRIARHLLPLLSEVPEDGRLLCGGECRHALLEEFSKIPRNEGRVVLEENDSLDASTFQSEELEFFNPDRLKVLSYATDRTFTLSAQGVLRSFAWGLPGFSGSRIPFLRANFLDFPASLEDQPDRRLVRMGHPPLGVILNMTGKSRETYRVSWLGGNPFTLFPEA